MDAARVVLVTNVGHGYGRAVALAFGAAGHNVVCADRDVDQASKTAAEIEEGGGNAIPVQSDMMTQLDVLGTIRKVFELYGSLDGIVHSASYESNTSFRELADNEFGELLDESLRSTFLTLRVAARVQVAHLWMTVVGPPKSAAEPQMALVHAALAGLIESCNRRVQHLRSNLLTPSRPASDPRHDQSLVDAALYLAGQGVHGVGGQNLHVALPPPPRISETLLPEVRAALDVNVRQDDLEASLDDDYDDYDGPDEGDDDEDEDEDGYGDDAPVAGVNGAAGGHDYPDYFPGLPTDDYFDFEDLPDARDNPFYFGPGRDPLG